MIKLEEKFIDKLEVKNATYPCQFDFTFYKDGIRKGLIFTVTKDKKWVEIKEVWN